MADNLDIEPDVGVAFCGWSTPAAERAHPAVAPGRLPEGYRFPDVSNYVRVADWPTFGRAYPAAACKATEGRTYIDPTWRGFLAGCRKHGTLPIGYHFLRRESDAEAQARHFLAQLDRDPCGIMLDVETSGSGSNPTMAQASEWLTAVARLSDRRRDQMLVYLPRWWWQAHGDGSHALADTLLVSSDYRSTPNIAPFAGFLTTTVIQFGSTIPIAGASRPGDMNIAIGRTSTQLAAALGCTTGAATPPPEDDVRPAEWTVQDREAVGRAVMDHMWTLMQARPDGAPDDWHPPRQADAAAVIRRAYEMVGGSWADLGARLARLETAARGESEPVTVDEVMAVLDEVGDTADLVAIAGRASTLAHARMTGTSAPPPSEVPGA